MELEATITKEESMMMLVIDESNVTPWSWLSSVSPTLLPSSPPTYESSQIDWEMIEYLERIKTNRRLSDTFFYPLLFAYALMIGFGVLANCLIIALVVRQRSSHQLRHLLMINLSVSDLLLCLVTMPLTFMELVCFSWPLGNNPVLCKLAGSMEGVSIYCSTLTIASIALDRYHVIVFSTGSREGRSSLFTAPILISAIWLGSVLLASPLLIFRSLKHHPLPQALLGVEAWNFCVEEWPDDSSAALIYSIASMMFQFFIPVAVIVFAHASICARLRQRFRRSNRNGLMSATAARRQHRRHNKTHQLLSAIALTFAVCWLPLNLFNLLDDSLSLLADKPQWRIVAYALCHLSGMSSACLNPVLYGWLNQNVRSELARLFPRLLKGAKDATERRYVTTKGPASSAPDTGARIGYITTAGTGVGDAGAETPATMDDAVSVV